MLETNDGYYEVYSPRTARQTKRKALAPRLSTLNGKTVAQLWDFLFRGDIVFELLEKGLREKFPDVRFVNWKEFGNTHGSDERAVLAALPDRLKALGVHAVISGMACWGSCTPAVLRASAVCEEAGIPSASLTGEGFIKQFKATSVGLGIPDIPFALVPGHPLSQSSEQLEENVLNVTLGDVIENLTCAQQAVVDTHELATNEVVFRGGFEAVNRFFIQHELGDGLPVVPPTRERIEAFLSFTDRDPGEVLGVMLPDRRSATIWSIAVNAVMAGCRPEYMPVLVALIEAMVDPAYGVEHSGNTPGGETLIILNGPIIQQLGFNFEQGVLRDGFLANTSVGRFWRLYLRNVAGFLLHKTDKATVGNTWRVVMAENEEVLANIGWTPISADMGFKAGDNTVTIARYTGGNLLASVTGSDPEVMLPYVAENVRRQVSWQVMFTVGMGMGTLRPLVLLSPILAQTIAAAGWSKPDVQRYLFQHARMPAWEFERQLRDWNPKPVWNLAEEVRLGHIPAFYHESDDPDRLVPIVWKPEDYMIAVTGDLHRNNAYVFSHNGSLGYPVAKEIRLPKSWERKLAGRDVINNGPQS